MYEYNKIYREKNKFRLQPANPTLFPVYRKEVEVQGIVVKIIRNLDNQIKKEKVSDKKFKRRIEARIKKQNCKMQSDHYYSR